MNKYERYYASNKLNVNKNLIKKYGVYHCDNYNIDGNVVKCRDFALITNGFSIIAIDNISADYERFDDNMNNRLIEFFNNFNDRNIYKYKDYLSLDTIKNNLNEDKNYSMNNGYGIGYMQLKKIIDIIGYVKINILEKDEIRDTIPVIEIIGKNGCVGYLLPTRNY